MMTEFQKEKLELMHDIASVKTQISSLDKRLQFLYDEITRIQEIILDMEEKEYE